MIVSSHPRHRSYWAPVGRTEKTQPYYAVRTAPLSFTNYWSDVTDPDGLVRDRFSDEEKVNFLSDRAEEIAFVNSLAPGVVLDFGCGPGWMLEAIDCATRLGIEVADDAIARLRGTSVEVRRQLWDVADQECDVAICYHVIEHLADPLDALTHLRRVLVPRGWLILGTPDFHSPCAQRFGDRYRMLHDPTHVSLFTNESMHRCLRDHGFVIHDVKYPFPDRFATQATFARWADRTSVSPPWPGNWMTFYCTRSNGG